jgi:hypothetical protein
VLPNPHALNKSVESQSQSQQHLEGANLTKRRAAFRNNVAAACVSEVEVIHRGATQAVATSTSPHQLGQHSMSAARGARWLWVGGQGARLALASAPDAASIAHPSRYVPLATRPDVGCSFWVTSSRWYGTSTAAHAGGPVVEGQREDGNHQTHDVGAVLVEEVSGDEDVDVHVEDSWDDQGGVIVDQPPRSHLQTLPPSLPTSASPSTSVSSAETMQIDPTMEISLPREPDPY